MVANSVSLSLVYTDPSPHPNHRQPNCDPYGRPKKGEMAQDMVVRHHPLRQRQRLHDLDPCEIRG